MKHVLPAKVGSINRESCNHHRTRKRQEWGGGGSMKKFVCQRDQEHENHYLNAPSLVNIILYSNFKIVSSIPCFQPLSALWENYK